MLCIVSIYIKIYCFLRVSNDIRRILSGRANLEYIVPVELCVMINVLCRADEQVSSS